MCTRGSNRSWRGCRSSGPQCSPGASPATAPWPTRLAFARAIEAAHGIEVPPRAVWLRALMAELERLANHFGDIGAICNDAAFAMMHAQCGLLREQVLRVADRCFGHRLMMDRVVPGGVRRDLPSDGRRPIRDAPRATFAQRFPELVELYDNTASLQDRTVGTGILSAGAGATVRLRRLCRPGFRTRASTQDARPATRPTMSCSSRCRCSTDGDVNARIWIRVREVEQSMSLIEQILRAAPVRVDRPCPEHAAGDRCARRGGAGRGLSRRRAGLGPDRCRRQHRALPPARPFMVPVAVARSRHRRQHRRRLPAVQQVVQLLVLGP